MAVIVINAVRGTMGILRIMYHTQLQKRLSEREHH